MAHTFQGMISALQAYWEEQGCTIMQPYHTEVGAGTSNPATFLRVLGPRPWRTGYVEPSIRPDDGRYGENPFRFQQFYQYQVILKPAPADVQDLYLASLQAIGIDVPRHDVRFVEDNWENPTLGASGLGWEVWMDGMEITQFTYFQQAGGFDLDPISVELAYGLERLGMYLQGVRRAHDMLWSPHVSWGDVFLQNERQMSTYNYEVADTAVHARHFDDFEAEARRCIDARLPLPAYDYVLKCSHAFNLLDARRAIAVTDRAGYILRMRRLAQAVAARTWRSRKPVPDLLVEIGCEELPAAACRQAQAQLPGLLETELARAGLAAGERRVHVAPRRLAAIALGLPGERPAERSEVRGPREDAPDQALAGFARKHGLDPAGLERRDGFVWAVSEGAPTQVSELVPEVVRGVVEGIQFSKSMRWEGGRFSRPIRWLVVKLDDAVVPMRLAGLESGDTTCGHRYEGGHTPSAPPRPTWTTCAPSGRWPRPPSAARRSWPGSTRPGRGRIRAASSRRSSTWSSGRSCSRAGSTRATSSCRSGS